MSSNTHDIESFRSPGRGPGGQYFQSKTDIIPENAHSGGRERLPHKTADKGRKRMAIITSYFAGETYGLLGPQMAATVIHENDHHECIVVAVAREDDKVVLKKGMRLSRVNLTVRADWFVRGERRLREALRLARSMGVRIVLASVGLESFDDTILRNLNKGLKVETNLRAIQLMRKLRNEFPNEWGYSRRDGASHGLIHPTPWDTEKTSANIQRITDRYALPVDILPDHSIPLIIHHASGLGDWIREIERIEGRRFGRHGSIIGWWDGGGCGFC